MKTSRKLVQLTFMALLGLTANAQGGTNKVYASEGVAQTILEEGCAREILGGTKINVKYIGSKISLPMKGAFEYACKLWEEKMPTTFPLNITVKFTKHSDPQDLARVTVYTDSLHGQDKVFSKRLANTYERAMDYSIEYLRDTPDAVIDFSTGIPFDYHLDASKVSKDKYDFVTVALQAIGKAVGFMLNAQYKDGALEALPNANRFTLMLFGHDLASKFMDATSGNVEIESTNSKARLYSPPTFDPLRSLGYFEEDPDNKETLLMQPFVVTKGTAIRYIGKGFKTFFSYCGWDPRIATSIDYGSSSVESASTDMVIPYKGTSSAKSQVAKVSASESLGSYVDRMMEFMPDGFYVMLEDGSWKECDRDFTDLDNKTNYARTIDGYLRVKLVTTSVHPGFPSNRHARYWLYDFLPQKPQTELVSHKLQTSPTSVNRVYSSTESEGYDVTIGFKNTEGCKSIEVEQTDEDYPVPYYYTVDPSEGTFNAYVPKGVKSTLKVTYINDNGATSGEPFTINPTLFMDFNPGDMLEWSIDEGSFDYNLSGTMRPYDGTYKMMSMTTGNNVSQGKVVSTQGSVDISTLPSGSYVFSIKGTNGDAHSVKWQKK